MPPPTPSQTCCAQCASGAPTSNIHRACSARHPPACVANLLLRDPTCAGFVRRKDLMTPCMVAAMQNNVRAVELLLETGPLAHIERVSAVGDTALSYAVRAGSLAAASALIAARARIDVRDADGASPLFLAARRSHAQMVALLLDAKASPKLRTGQCIHELTALHAACMNGSEQCVKLLLDAGGDQIVTALEPETSMMLEMPEGRLHTTNSLLASLVQVFAMPELLAGAHSSVGAMARTEAKTVACAQLLLGCGAGKHLLSADANLLVIAARLGLPRLVRLLAAHGASREAVNLCASASCVIPPPLRSAESAARAAVAEFASKAMPTELAREAHGWLQRTRLYATPLHHFADLPPAAVGALLRGKADVHARCSQPGAPSPLSLAQAAHGASAALILAAASGGARWSPATHQLYTPATRARAASLLRVGYLLSSRLPPELLAGRGRELCDLWIAEVMPRMLPDWTADEAGPRADEPVARRARRRRGRRPDEQAQPAAQPPAPQPRAPHSAPQSESAVAGAERFAPGAFVRVSTQRGLVSGDGARSGRVLRWLDSSLRYEIELCGACRQRYLAAPAELRLAPSFLSREPMPPPDDLPEPLDARGERLPNRRSAAWAERFGAGSLRPLLYKVHTECRPKVGALPAARMPLRTRVLELCELTALTVSEATAEPEPDAVPSHFPGEWQRLLRAHEIDCTRCQPQLSRTFGHWGITSVHDAMAWANLEGELLADARDAITRADLDWIAQRGWSGTVGALMAKLAAILEQRRHAGEAGSRANLRRFYPQQQ